jgi:hypothetical protein
LKNYSLQTGPNNSVGKVKYGKVVPALCQEHIWGSGGIAPPFLTSALAGRRLVSKVKVKFSLCLTNYALRHEGVWGVDV